MNRAEPVSYTHLQELRTQGNAVLSSGIGFEEDTEFARFASAAFEQAEIAFENTFGTLEETPGIGGFGPVSYTHLDVYKRQSLFWTTRMTSIRSTPLLHRPVSRTDARR